MSDNTITGPRTWAEIYSNIDAAVEQLQHAQIAASARYERSMTVMSSSSVEGDTLA